MFVIQGRILTINTISDKSAQVVLQKQVNGKKTPIAINVWGYWKERMEGMKLQKNEKIQGKVFVKSTLWKNKWFTDFYFREFERVAEKPKNEKSGGNLFEGDSFISENNNIVDPETGEIIF